MVITGVRYISTDQRRDKRDQARVSHHHVTINRHANSTTEKILYVSLLYQ